MTVLSKDLALLLKSLSFRYACLSKDWNGTANKLIKLFEEDREQIKALGRASGSALELHRFFQRWPIGSVPEAHRELNISAPTLHASAKHLVKLGILRELSGKTRYRVFSYVRYLDVLNEDEAQS
jgi:hypothetical protein